MIKILKKNLRYRLLFILIFSLLVGYLIVGTFLYQHFDNFLYNRFRADLTKYLDLTEYTIDKEKILERDQKYLRQFVNSYAKKLNCRITVMSEKGEVISDSEIPDDQIPKLENHLNRPEILQLSEQMFGSNIRQSKTLAQNLLYMAKKIEYQNKQIGYLRLAILTDDVDNLLVMTRNYFIGGGIFVLLISSLLVGIFSKQITSDLFEIINKARQIAKGNLDSKINIKSKDELNILGNSLNEMARRLSDYLAELQRDKNNLNTVLSSVNDGIVAINPDKKIVVYNNQAQALLNYSGQEMKSKNYTDIINNQHLVSLLDNFFVRPLFIKDDVRFEDRTLDVIITPLTADGSDSKGAVLVLRDITEINMLSKIRRDFVANVSHEFKTPLAAIRGYAETLLDWALEDNKVSKKYVQKIIKQSNQLENLVSDLLELARIEKLQNLQFRLFNPNPIIKDTVEELSTYAADKKLNVMTTLDTGKINVRGEPEMFRSIIFNLLDNAIKYTPAKGKILIKSEINDKTILFSISDSGVGIPKNKQVMIYDKARSRSIGGTGLGLSIVKHLAELQKAEVKLESDIGKGSRFTVSFPLN